jgi:hypothetical protein
MKCLGCGALLSDGSQSCDYCGKVVMKSLITDSPNPTSLVTNTNTNTNTNEVPNEQSTAIQQVSEQAALANSSYMEGLSDDYKALFSKFDLDTSTSPKFSFGWAPFLFGPLWYLYKGLWAKGLIYLVVAFSTIGSLAFIPWIYGTCFGSYDLYLLKKHNKQLW